jgi:hypothetical protein
VILLARAGVRDGERWTWPWDGSPIEAVTPDAEAAEVALFDGEDREVYRGAGGVFLQAMKGVYAIAAECIESRIEVER